MSAPSRRPLSIVVSATAGLLLCAGIFLGGYLLGYGQGRTGVGPLIQLGLVPPPSSPEHLTTDDQKLFGTFWEVWGAVERSYYRRDALDHQALVRGATRGLVDAVGDPYTTYLTPERREASDAELRGSFDGIGAQLDLRDGKLTVVAPVDGSPSAQAGLLAGDVISRVDGEDISKLSLSDAVARIRGPRGSTVTLTVVRSGQAGPLAVAVVRGEIKLASVTSRMLDGGIGYTKVSTFAEPTAGQLRDQLRPLLAAQPRGLVLDLRGNPGGYLASAVDISSLFLRDGVVLYQQGAARDDRKVYRVTGTAAAVDVPLVVLVDHGSASAAEIVAAALRENGRATLVGELTFGKGTVQEVKNLGDDSQLRVTVAQWLTPAGRPIQGQGLQPDVAVQRQDGRDAPLEAAVEYLATHAASSRG